MLFGVSNDCCLYHPVPRSGHWGKCVEMALSPVWMAPFLQVLFCDRCFVRSSLVFGLLARRTWPLALMVSTNQVPFRTSNSKRSGQSSITSLVFQSLVSRSLSSNSSHFVWLISGQHSPDHAGSFVSIATAATLLGLRDRMSANHGSNFSDSSLIDRIREVMPRTNKRRMY